MTEEQKEFTKNGIFTIVETASKEDCAIMMDCIKEQIEYEYEKKFGKIENYDVWLFDISAIITDFTDMGTFESIDIQTKDGIDSAFYL